MRRWLSYNAHMPKDSLTNSFIVKIKWVNDNLKIILQNIHTREVIELSTWPELFKELISQPLDSTNLDSTDNAQSVTLSREWLEQLPDTASDIVPGNHYAYDQHGDNHDDGCDNGHDKEDDRLKQAVSKTNAMVRLKL